MKNRLVSRRQALRLLGAAGAAAGGSLLFTPSGTSAQTAAPAVRKKVRLKYWTWSDTPAQKKIHEEAIEMFHKAQNFITVEPDVTSAVMEVRQKLIAAFAAGSAPDVAGVNNYYAQEHYDNGILSPVEEYFKKWGQRDDFFPRVIEIARSKPGQPVLHLPRGILAFVLYYRADWFDEAKLKPPATYDEFIEAARKLTRTPTRYGYGLRGKDYFGVQPLETEWRSAGVKIADETGKVDLDSPAAVAVTEKWVGMFTRDKSAQPPAVNDRYQELFALMEANRLAMFIYGIHAQNQFDRALGNRIQVVPPPRVKDSVMMAVPSGNMIVSSCKEKEAAWELVSFLGSGDAARIFTRDGGWLPVRKSLAAEPAYQTRFFKLAAASESLWWCPPYFHKHWAKFMDKITPYWQQTLRQEISVKDFHVRAASILRGEA